MVKLRLRRTGKKHTPSYQIVAIDSRKARDAGFLEKVGHYFPLHEKWDIDKEKVLKWLNWGAQPSETVLNILRKEKLWAQFIREKQISRNRNQKAKVIKQEKIEIQKNINKKNTFKKSIKK